MPSAVLADDTPRVVVTPLDLSADRFILDGVNLTPDDPITNKPIKLLTFSVGEAAKFFFARSADWMRWRESHGFFTLDGHPVGTLRTTPPPVPKSRNGRPSPAARKAREKTEAGQRRYTLADIEKIAHALAEKGAIPTSQLLMTLRLVTMVAQMYGILPQDES